MKAIVINASPRKTWNTAQLLKSAAEGTKSAGAGVEYINLYDLNFTGCRGCMLCKRKGVERCHCYWKDDLSPVIDKIFRADWAGRPAGTLSCWNGCISAHFLMMTTAIIIQEK